MFKLYDMGVVKVAFKAFEKMTGLSLSSQERPTRNEPALNDANDYEKKQHAGSTLGRAEDEQVRPRQDVGRR